MSKQTFTSRNAWHFAVAAAYPLATSAPRVLTEARITDGAVIAEWDALTNTGWMRSLVVPQAVPATDDHAGYVAEAAYWVTGRGGISLAADSRFAREDDAKAWAVAQGFPDAPVVYGRIDADGFVIPEDVLEEAPDSSATVLFAKTGTNGIDYRVTKERAGFTISYKGKDGGWKTVDSYDSLARAKSVLEKEVLAEAAEPLGIALAKTGKTAAKKVGGVWTVTATGKPVYGVWRPGHIVASKAAGVKAAKIVGAGGTEGHVTFVKTMTDTGKLIDLNAADLAPASGWGWPDTDGVQLASTDLVEARASTDKIDWEVGKGDWKTAKEEGAKIFSRLDKPGNTDAVLAVKTAAAAAQKKGSYLGAVLLGLANDYFDKLR